MEIMGKELKFAVDLVAECTTLAKRIQAEMVTSAMEKSDRSPVTVADYALQALVGKRIRDEYPGAVLVAEESSETIRKPENSGISGVITKFLNESIPEVTPQEMQDWTDIGSSETEERYWVLDPIDGTKGFLRNAHYVVALALIEEGELILGILGCPSLDLTPDANGWTYSLTPEGPGVILYAQKDLGTWIKGKGRNYRMNVSTRLLTTATRV